jgi:hypothetical protein
MSMELLVFMALDKTPNVDQWNEALRQEHVPVQITESVDLAARPTRTNAVNFLL